ncbi:hypothetical protein [Desulfatibacillum aliphaticivorans]|uniref:hypothetical protein n=1 Tax=Desulfatibacillum aliphaticivorans TaxID=218208 RepID=UPI0003F83FF9|nr:hypothetical protein [Desulfatibacillum aliphaticivorans]
MRETQARERYVDGGVSEDFNVVLPCSPDNFVSFISSLLGKPQSIEKVIHGTFSINAHDIEDLYHTVDQRIQQQNQAKLVQFSVKIVYNDDSSIMLNSLTDFLHYREMRPLVSTSVHLTWIYLIQFQDKKHPEKQQIDLTIVADKGTAVLNESLYDPIAYPIFMWRSKSFIMFRIDHTARTWAVDIESLLSGQIENMVTEEEGLRKIISDNNVKFGLGVAIIFLVIVFIGAYFSTNNFINQHLEHASSQFELLKGASNDVGYRIDFLVDLIIKGTTQRFHFIVGSFILLSIIASFFVFAFTASLADNRPASFVLLSKKSEEAKEKYLKKRNKEWYVLIGTALLSIFLGIMANILFALLSRHWMLS